MQGRPLCASENTNVEGNSFLVVVRVLAMTGSSFAVVVHSLLALWILVALHINLT